MPLYEFQCRSCNALNERIFSVANLPEEIPCECGGVEKQNVGCAILRDEPTWLPSARKTLQGDNEKPLESRSEYKQYLKKHGIEERG